MKELKMLEVVGGRADMNIMSSLKWTEWAYQSHLQWREKVTLSAFYGTLYEFAVPIEGNEFRNQCKFTYSELIFHFSYCPLYLIWVWVTNWCT